MQQGAGKSRFLFRMLLGLCGIVCALGALSARAQSSVTVYGILDSSILYMSKSMSPTGANAGRYFGFGDSGYAPSQFGITGVEDLGGGLKAQFKLESGINTGTGSFNDSNDNLWGRQAWVAINSEQAGQVKLGLQFSPFFNALFDLDPRASLTGSTLLPYLDNVLGTGVFTPNAVSYTSPVVYGFQGSVLWAFGNNPGNFQAGRQISASLKYTWQNLLVEAAWYNSHYGNVLTNPPTDVPFEGRMIGAAYNFGKVNVKASFTSYKVADNVYTGSGHNNNVYGVGASWMLTPTINLNGAAYYVSNRDDGSSHSLFGVVGSQYFLSRRTALYGQVAVINNHGSATQGLVTGENELPTNTLFLPAGTTAIVDLGIRHSF